MKTSGRCPKCSSDDLICVPGPSPGLAGRDHRSEGLVNMAFVARYVCGGCGYSEEWVDLKDLQALRKRYGG